MHNGQLTITPAGIDDAGMLTELGIVIFRDSFGPQNRQEDMDKYVAEEMNLQKITNELKDANNRFFIARINGQPAGYAKLRSSNSADAPECENPIEIERLYVAHKHHGQKIGAALMARCIDTARALGCDTIWLGVWEHNYKGRDFYTKWGFELYGSHPFILGNDPQTDVLMKYHIPDFQEEPTKYPQGF